MINLFPLPPVKAPDSTEHPALFEKSFPWVKYYDVAAKRSAQMATGCVTMVHGGRADQPAGIGPGNWTIYRPDGSVLSTPGSLTSGLQEAIDYAYFNGFCLRVYGGQIPVIGGAGRDVSLMGISAPVQFRVGWMTDIELSAVTFQHNPNGPIGYTNDLFTFDSCDLTSIRFNRCQVIMYSRTGATNSAFRYKPQTDNGEDFAGISTSAFELPTIVVLNFDGSLCFDGGRGIRFSTPNLGLGLGQGDGLMVQCRLKVGEINGGEISMLVDNPGSNNGFIWNTIDASSAIHRFGVTGLSIGEDATNSTLIHSNIWHLSILAGEPGSIGVKQWGGRATGGDVFYGHIDGADYGIEWESSALRSKVFGIVTGGIADVNNLSGGATNVVY